MTYNIFYKIRFNKMTMKAELNKYFYNDITNIIMDYYYEDYKTMFNGIMYDICEMMDEFSRPFLRNLPEGTNVEKRKAWGSFSRAYMFNYKLINNLFPEDSEDETDSDFDEWQNRYNE